MNAQDGRVLRTESTRNNILEVTRDLILSGTVEPTAKQIATSADITTRTLFRHFSDMEALYRSLIEQAEAGAIEVLDEPFNENPSEWLVQMQTLIDRRVRVYESLLPLYISTIWRRYELLEKPRSGVKRRRQRLKSILPDHLNGQTILFEALDATLSIEYWVSLRRDQGLSTNKATATLHFAVGQLLQTNERH